MAGHSLEAAADRAGVEPVEIARLTELGILAPDPDVGYSDADLRRVQVARALERAGLELQGLADLLRGGSVSLRFLDEAGSNVFTPLSDVTFAELSERSGVPLDMLTLLREVTGGRAPRAGERVREDELEDRAARRVPGRARVPG